MATSFGWKKKASQNVSRKRARPFDDESDNSSINEPLEIDWRAHVKRNAAFLEDNVTKSARLKTEGGTLAEEGRYWEAIGRWNEAMEFTAKDETLYEMKAQALLELNEVYPAIEAAQKAVELNPLWPVAYQTLGRTQLGFGEVELALRNFSKAFHLMPDHEEIWKEDLIWAQKLQEEQRQMNCQADKADSSKAKIVLDMDDY